MNSLVDPGLLEHDTLLEAARQLVRFNGMPAAITGLQSAHGLDEQKAAEITAAAFGLTSIRLSDLPEKALALSLASFAEYLRRQVLVIDTEAACLVVAPNPLDAGLRDWLESLLPLSRRIDWRLAPASVIAAYLAREESRVRALDGNFNGDQSQVSPGENAEDLSLQGISEEGSNIVRLVRSTLHDGLKAGASDIHIEANNRGLAIKYRIDGVLNFAGAIDGSDTAEQMISRIKVLSELDIAERRVPQDGRFKVNWQGREIDIRVSIMPSIWGEDAVLRVLDKQALSDHLDGLRLDVRKSVV